MEKPNSIKPILIATPEIMKAALANEAIINKKAENSGNGEFICIKDFITKKDWKECLKTVSDNMKPVKVIIYDENKNIQIQIMNIFKKNKIVSVDQLRSQNIPIDNNHRRDLNDLYKNGYIMKHEKRGTWIITDKGYDFV
jgi:predicted transcriptional regulator